MSSKDPCPCRAVMPDGWTYEDLACTYKEHADDPAYSTLVLTERGSSDEIRCTACGARWVGHGIPGGGIYSDVEWRRVEQ